MKKHNFLKQYAAFFFCLYLAYLMFFSFFLHGTREHFSFNFSTLVMPAIELFFLFCLGAVFWRCRKALLTIPAILVVLALPLIALLVYASQAVSATLTGVYISVLALENTREVAYVTRPEYFIFLTILLVPWVLLAIRAVHLSGIPRGTLSKTKEAFLSITLIVMSAGLFFAALNRTPKPKYYFLMQPELSPVMSLTLKIREISETREFNENNLKAVTAAGFSIRPYAPFPFMKEKVYSHPLPFDLKADSVDQPNVIVIFLEGISARWMDSYGGKYPDLTPNLDAFAKRSMRVDNYFGHTAATYRGLLGQLASGYIEYGGAVFQPASGSGKVVDEMTNKKRKETKYQTATKMLNSRGYETAMLAPHKAETSFIDFLRSIGFQKVYGYEGISELLDGRDLIPYPSLDQASDTDLFEALEQYIRQAPFGDKPFFVSTYNIGTHAFYDAETHYRDGKNSVLNRIQHGDRELGKFLDFFLASKYAENTLLIVTSDHSTFPEPPTIAALEGTDFQPFFVDRIPLLIHAPYLDLPNVYDAKIRNSVDFAPTLLHLLSIEDEKNAFIGHSIFEDLPAPHKPMSAIGYQFFDLSDAGVVELEREAAERDEYVNLIRFFYAMAYDDRIFDQ